MASPLGSSYFFKLLRPMAAACSLTLAGLAALTVPVAAQDYRDQGFYQSYVFGAPDEPSEEWLLAYGGRLYDLWWAPLEKETPKTTNP